MTFCTKPHVDNIIYSGYDPNILVKHLVWKERRNLVCFNQEAVPCNMTEDYTKETKMRQFCRFSDRAVGTSTTEKQGSEE